MTKINKHEWLKTIGVSVGILVLISMLCMVISLISVASIRTTEPYRHSVDLALKSPKVRQALGEPLTVGWLPQGNVNDSNGGEAQLNISLRGPNGSATIRVNGTNIDGTWKYWAIRVDTDQGAKGLPPHDGGKERGPDIV
jgi:hypothetical protein